MKKAGLEWFNCAHSNGMPISDPMLREKTCKFVSDFGAENFNASNSWLDRFWI